MLRVCLALLAGASLLHRCAALPAGCWLAPAFAVALTGLVSRRTRAVALVLLGFCIAWQSSLAVIGDRLAPELDGVPLCVTGVVADFPEQRGRAWRFVLETADINDVPTRIRLSWYDARGAPGLGEAWTLRVRLRRPRGFANPALFDYEEWLFRQRIGATGYVVKDSANRRLDHPAIALRNRLRRHVAERIVDLTGDNDASAVLTAITVGARQRITATEWERYAATGTSHLMAISGLHVGLAALGAWMFCRVCFAMMSRWRNVRDLAMVGAGLAGIAYAMLSGFAIPAQRALLMLLAAIGLGLLRREVRIETVFALAAITVFLFDPLSILAPGFMLSFAAVAILLWSARQRGFHGGTVQEGVRGWFVDLACRLPQLQFVLLLGLLPLTTMLFGRVSWVAPAVNLAVLPFFNLVTVPAALAGALIDGPLHPAGDFLLRVSWHSIRLILGIVASFADWPPAQLHVAAAAPLLLPAALLATVWALLPPGWPGRRLAFVAALATTVARPAGTPPECIDVTTLDVGQGLSVVLQTQHRTAVFDTGPTFLSGGDTGKLVLVPFLRHQGIAHVDLLIVSHADSDHAGGAASLVSQIDVAEVMAGQSVRLPGKRPMKCHRGQAWLWDGVRFAIMHPEFAEPSSDNDRSCVLEVSAGGYRALLTGDIEADVEQRLLETGSLMPAEAVVVPHHGSRTSSSAVFVRRLQPKAAIISAGFDNRWGLPDDEIVRRWEREGAQVVNTAVSGAIRFRMCGGTGLQSLREQRVVARRYWHEKDTS